MRKLLMILTTIAAGPAFGDLPRIVVDTPITGSMVQQVAGSLGQVHVLLPQGASAHHHQMRPSDAQKLQDAELLVWTGPELTPWLARSAEAVATNTRQVRLLQVPKTRLRSFAEDAHEEHPHDTAHDADQGSDSTNRDPHAWLDPSNVTLWLEFISDTLGQADPGNAAIYARNAQVAARQIADVDKEFKTLLATHASADFVVFHDAYGYFTDHYGLRPAIAVSLGDASAPSAARLADIRNKIRASGATCAFPEYASDPELMEAVIEGTDVRLGDALSPEGQFGSTGDNLVRDAISSLGKAINDCLSAR